MIDGMSRIGRNLEDSQNWAQHMRDVGFIDVVEHKLLVPIGPWARGKKNKILGAKSLQNMIEGVSSMSTAPFTRILGWTQERLETFLAGVRDNLSSEGVHAYGVFYFCHGRRPPLSAEEA